MKTAIVAFLCALLAAAPAAAQETDTPPVPAPGATLKIFACAPDPASAALMRDPVVLESLGEILTLGGSRQDLAVRLGPCGSQAPDAACFGAPGGIFCRVTVFERIIRAGAATIASYRAAGSPGYESFWSTHQEGVARAFQFADGARSDAGAEALRGTLRNDGATDHVLLKRLLEYNLAALLGHEISHTRAGLYCPLKGPSLSERTGLLLKTLRDEQAGRIFAQGAPSQEEYVADQCGLRHVRALNALFSSAKPALSAPDTEFLQRSAADMVAFEMSFGWRRYHELDNGQQLPVGRYVVSSPSSYLYAPYRGLLFASEIAGNARRPPICGEAAEVLVVAIQATYQRYKGNGDIDDMLLALFPAGVAKAWNNQERWTPASFGCGRS